MQDWLIDLGLAAIFRLLKDAIKNPAKRASWRKAMLKLRDAIDLAYGNDSEFDVAPSRRAALKSQAKAKSSSTETA